MSAFARGQLEKYGWKEGKGLGKNEHGIATALRPKLKFDTCGVGHDPGKEFTNDWWNLAFNQAAKNITVVNSKNGVVVNSKTSNKCKKEHKSSKGHYNSNFVKTSTLLSNGEIQFEKEQDVDSVKGDQDVDTTAFARITEEELVAKCGGRTAHKAARHGFKLSGKLIRLQQQEALLLKPNTYPTNSPQHHLANGQHDIPSQKKRRHKRSKKIINEMNPELSKISKRIKLPEGRIKKKKKKS